MRLRRTRYDLILLGPDGRVRHRLIDQPLLLGDCFEVQQVSWRVQHITPPRSLDASAAYVCEPAWRRTAGAATVG
jgi:hypothetical protein